MNDPLKVWGEVLRKKRTARKLTQQGLAEKHGMNKRTVMDAELGRANSKFETVIILARELDISLDAIVFPESASPNIVPKCVYDFFKDMTEEEAQRYIDFCKSAKALSEQK